MSMRYGGVNAKAKDGRLNGELAGTLNYYHMVAPPPPRLNSTVNTSFATRAKRTARRQQTASANGMIARAFLNRLDKDKVKT